MSEFVERFAMGWLPDYSDFRDYTAHTKSILPLMKKVKGTGNGKKKPKFLA